jgi:hypothetical protein|tara:strand:+ start:3032 stop:3649 length:618 start_codon:yes stop_codon:yes gene_type:complete
MAYGDINTADRSRNRTYREKNGVQTVNRAVLLKDSSTKGSAAINFLNDTLDLDNLTNVEASNRAGVYVGTQGDLCVLLSGQSQPIATGTATATTSNVLTDNTKNFSLTLGVGDGAGIKVQKRDIVVNTTDGTSAFIKSVNGGTNGPTLDLVDVSNSASNIMASGETYEIYRAVMFQNIAAGSLLPIQVDRIFDLGTTADDIIALY